MRLGVFSDGACSPSGSYQLLFQGEMISGRASLDTENKGHDTWKSLKSVIERLRPGQFSVLAQDLDFNVAKKHMKQLISLGIVTYIEPMGNSLVNTRLIF